MVKSIPHSDSHTHYSSSSDSQKGAKLKATLAHVRKIVRKGFGDKRKIQKNVHNKIKNISLKFNT